MSLIPCEADEGLEMNAEKIQKLITSSGIKIQDYYSKFFSTNMANSNISLLLRGGGGGGSDGPKAKDFEDKV